MSETVCQRKTANNIAKVRARIQQAARENARDVKDIHLLAVSKTRSVDDIKEAFAAGINDFGENYAQEALGKIVLLSALPLSWHFIGPLQSNKTEIIAQYFAWLHSLDRLKIAERLSRQRQPQQAPLNVCIQVNIGDDVSKSGITPAALPDFAVALVKLPHLSLRGLMAIPAPAQQGSGKDQLKYAFRSMRKLFEGLQLQFPKQQYPQLNIDTLSMGMSADLELAIAEGSTLVRVGTDIFGPRNRFSQG
jgi:PLP dependent protein